MGQKALESAEERLGIVRTLSTTYQNVERKIVEFDSQHNISATVKEGASQLATKASALSEKIVPPLKEKAEELSERLQLKEHAKKVTESLAKLQEQPVVAKTLDYAKEFTSTVVVGLSRLQAETTVALAERKAEAAATAAATTAAAGAESKARAGAGAGAEGGAVGAFQEALSMPDQEIQLAELERSLEEENDEQGAGAGAAAEEDASVAPVAVASPKDVANVDVD